MLMYRGDGRNNRSSQILMNICVGYIERTSVGNTVVYTFTVLSEEIEEWETCLILKEDRQLVHIIRCAESVPVSEVMSASVRRKGEHRDRSLPAVSESTGVLRQNGTVSHLEDSVHMNCVTGLHKCCSC
jgi:hypothetical protein